MKSKESSKVRSIERILAPSKAILLGFERGVRRVDASKSYPAALKKAPADKYVLDWILAALSECGIQDVVFVGGYHIEKVMERYPHLKFYYDPEWPVASYADALRRILHELDGPCIISETDVVYRSPLLKRLLAAPGDVHLAVGATGEHRISVQVDGSRVRGFSDDGAPPYFAGLMALSAKATAALRRHIQAASSENRGMEYFLNKLLREKLDLGVTPSREDLAPAASVSSFALGTKAKTLERLRPILRSATILEQICFTVREWRASSEAVLRRVTSREWKQVIVRSSAVMEDGRHASNAGRFRTVLGIDPRDAQALREAVQAVLESFAAGDADDPDNEIFVQPQVTDVKASGVCLTRDLETGAPYTIINYDRRTDRTDTVTSGQGGQTIVVNKLSPGRPSLDSDLGRLLEVAQELEYLLAEDALDIEFAVDRQGRCFVLQVRPIAAKQTALDDDDYREEAQNVRQFIRQLSRPAPHLFGQTTVLGIMPDWNPAEIIGTCPRPLALSLYQHLITDSVWGEARAKIGYRDTYPTPLLVSLAARPYIDVRASLNSFLPADVPPAIGAKIVDGGLAHLKAHPELHDKIEFEIAITCLAFDFDKQAERLKRYGLSAKEIEAFRRCLLRMTDAILTGRVAPIDALLEDVGKLKARCETLDSIPRTVRHLLEDCKRFGTLPFSILARYAFIATTILKSLVARGVFAAEEYQEFLAGIPTVATQVSRDLRTLSSKVFIERYGHLRPGTYDILSPTYRQAFIGGTPHADHADKPRARPEAVFQRKANAIARLLKEQGFTCTVGRLREFILKAIPARESSKFEFSRNISLSLDLLAEFGRRMELSRDEISFLPLEVLLRLGTDSASTALRTDLQRLAGSGSKRTAIARSMRLPYLIAGESDVDCFELLEWHPNYITRKSVTAPIIEISGIPENADLKGRVVLVESADPGYDWIFGHPIAGLVTQHGGVASHMAVRAAEFGLPAAIGCGEVIYRRLKEARVVELDCAAQQIRVVR